MDDDLVYACECGNPRFFLYKNGEVGCPDCGDRFSDIEVNLPPGIPVAEHVES